MRVLRNAFYLGAMQLSNILVALVVTPYVTRIFGSELLGINSFGLAVATNFAIFGFFGMTLYGLRTIATVRDNPYLLQQGFSSCITFQFTFFAIALFGYVLWALTTTDGFLHYYLLFVLYILGSATDLTWFYAGLERFDKVALRTVAMRVLGGLLVFLLVRRPTQLYLLIVLQQGTILLSNIFYWSALHRYGIRLVWAPLRTTLHKLFVPCLTLFLPIVFTTFLTTLDRVLLGYLSTKQEVAIYDYTARLVRIAITVVSVLGNVLLPRFAFLWNNDQQEEFSALLRQQQFSSLWISTLIAGGLFLTAPEVCSWLLGSTFVGASELLQMLLFTVCFTGLALYHVGMAIGQEKRILLALIFATLVNIAANLLLIPRWGSWGAGISYIVSEVLLQIGYIYILRRILPFRYMLRNFFWIALLVVGGIFLVRWVAVPNSILNFLLRGSIFVTFYVGLSLFIFSEVRRFTLSLLQRLGIVKKG